MRDLFLTLLIPLALLFAMCSARVSVLVLNWIWFQRPYDFSWGLWNTLPTFQIAIVITALSNLIHGEFRLKFPSLLVVYLLLMTWVTLSATFAYDSSHAWAFYLSYAPSMWVGPILMFATVHDLRLLKGIFWITAGGLGFNAFKYGMGLTGSGGAYIVNQIPGFVGDNNVFGLVLCLVVAMLLGLRTTLPDHRWARGAFFTGLVFVLLCIVYTKSRGALLTLGTIFLVASFLSGKPIRGLVVLLAAGIIGYLAVPGDYFDRLATLKSVETDASAMGRVENWRLAWNAALDHPLFGVGPDNHMAYNLAMSPDVQVRVAHSVYFQVLGELGFVGFALYLAFVMIGLLTLLRTWRAMIAVAKEHPDLIWVRDLAFWMTCGYAGYLAGSALLNMFYIEFPWYAVFYGSMMWPLVQAELAVRERGRAGGAGQNKTDLSSPLAPRGRHRVTFSNPAKTGRQVGSQSRAGVSRRWR